MASLVCPAPALASARAVERETRAGGAHPWGLEREAGDRGLRKTTGHVVVRGCGRDKSRVRGGMIPSITWLVCDRRNFCRIGTFPKKKSGLVHEYQERNDLDTTCNILTAQTKLKQAACQLTTATSLLRPLALAILHNL